MLFRKPACKQLNMNGFHGVEGLQLIAFQYLIGPFFDFGVGGEYQKTAFLKYPGRLKKALNVEMETVHSTNSE